MVYPGFIVGRRPGSAPFPGRDSAVGIACFFSAERGKVLAQTGSLLRVEFGPGVCYSQAGHKKTDHYK